MQSKYVGDKSDFAKFGLLRRISGLTDPDTSTPDLSLGIVWYLRPDECCKRDGGNTGYLCDTPRNCQHYRQCDPCLWEGLKSLVDRSRRCVHRIPGREILPEGTAFYECSLFFPDYFTTPQKEETRERWLRAALRKVEGTAIVYLDPDTGIAPDNVQPTHRNGSKYTYLEDIQRFWDVATHGLIVYQHLGRTNVDDFIQHKIDLLNGLPGLGLPIIVVRFGSRVFFALLKNEYRDLVEGRIQRMLDEETGWGRHFVRWGVPDA